MFRIIFLTLFTTGLLSSKVLIKPDEAMKLHFQEATQISKKSILLVKDEIKSAQKIAKRKISDRVFRVFVAKKGDQIVGYGLLHTANVRTKDETALYIIDLKGQMKAIEIIAFYEPPEYLPQKRWLNQFIDATVENELKLKKDIHTISGATLSARAVTDSAKIALSVLAIARKNGKL